MRGMSISRRSLEGFPAGIGRWRRRSWGILVATRPLSRPAVQHGPTTAPTDHTRKNDHATESRRGGPAIRNPDSTSGPVVDIPARFQMPPSPTEGRGNRKLEIRRP
jgi:hypothetical protein